MPQNAGTTFTRLVKNADEFQPTALAENLREWTNISLLNRLIYRTASLPARPDTALSAISTAASGNTV